MDREVETIERQKVQVKKGGVIQNNDQVQFPQLGYFYRNSNQRGPLVIKFEIRLPD